MRVIRTLSIIGVLAAGMAGLSGCRDRCDDDYRRSRRHWNGGSGYYAPQGGYYAPQGNYYAPVPQYQPYDQRWDDGRRYRSRRDCD